MSALVELKGVAKKYPRAIDKKHGIVNMMKLLINPRAQIGSAVLRDIDLTVRKGESLAIIGRNGAGKSTLLKIISGVIKPSQGQLIRRGRIGAMLELGSGFQMDYTGRENLKMAARLAGMRPKEVKQNLPRMIEFADIGEYIDEPVRHYSSGMVVRLGFSLITVTQPDLLITDEVLAVGDEKFQRKCIQWIDGYLRGGGTLLLVSHSMYHVQKLCKQAIWLKDGVICEQGDAYHVSQSYQAMMSAEADAVTQRTVSADNYHVHSLRVLDDAGQSISQVEMMRPLCLEVLLHSPDDRPPGLSIGLVRSDKSPVYGTLSELHGATASRVAANQFLYRVRFPKMNVMPGVYSFNAHAMNPENIQLTDTVSEEIRITGRTREMGVTRLDTEWS